MFDFQNNSFGHIGQNKSFEKSHKEHLIDLKKLIKNKGAHMNKIV